MSEVSIGAIGYGETVPSHLPKKARLILGVLLFFNYCIKSAGC